MPYRRLPALLVLVHFAVQSECLARLAVRTIRNAPVIVRPVFMEATEELARDPRLAPPWITENQELLDELAAESAAASNPTFASSSANVRPITSLSDFETALSQAEVAGHGVVVKYYTPRCRACLTIKPLYESMANKANDFLAASFYEVDEEVAKVLNAHANVKKMPIAQLYVPAGSGGGMELHGTWLIEKKANFDEFASAIVETVPLASTVAAAAEPATAEA